jgi:hypothetical protein
MEEKWIRWEPIPKLSKKYYVESIIDNINGFKILLSEENNTEEKVLVSFPDTIRAYRSTSDSFLIQTISYLDKTYGSNFYGNWTFFKIKDSKYLEWLNEESEGISKDYMMKHFCILAMNSMIDIVTGSEPTVVHIQK